MTEERSQRQRLVTVIATLAYALVAVDAVVAVWSLAVGGPWDWDRFWALLVVVVVSSGASSAAQALERQGFIVSRSQAQSRRDEEEATAQAMRTGIVPPGADPETWRARIARHVRRVRVIAALGTALCVSSAVLTALAAHLHNDDDPVLWVLAVVNLLFVAPLFWVRGRVRHREQRLLARLRR